MQGTVICCLAGYFYANYKILKMMQRTLLSLLVFYSSTLQAQTKIPVLLKGDFGISNVKTNNGKGSSSFAFGIGAETFIKIIQLDPAASLDINPGLSYLHTGYKSSAGGKVNVNYVSLALPVTLNIGNTGAESIGVLLGVGPFINVAASGRFRNLAIDDYKSMSFGNGTGANRTALDAGIVVKAGLKLQRVYLGLQNNIGTSNDVPKDRIANGSYIKTRNFLFYVSYRLGKK
jgi:hypothetical protein